MTPVLELKNVELKFGAFKLFSGVNIQIYSGESIVLVGPSGHGKTQLLRILSGLSEPTAGKVFWQGRPLAELNSSEERERLRKVGVLFQRNALFDSMTVFENVTFPLLETSQLTMNEIRERAIFYLNAVGLDKSAHLFPSEISGGMQKRLGIARALALQPEFVFYDDPTAGLDPITSRNITRLIQKMKAQGDNTIFTITNDMNRAFELAGRIFIMIDGQMIELGSADQAMAASDPRIHQFIHGDASGPLTEYS